MQITVKELALKQLQAQPPQDRMKQLDEIINKAQANVSEEEATRCYWEQ